MVSGSSVGADCNTMEVSVPTVTAGSAFLVYCWPPIGKGSSVPQTITV